MKYIRIFLFLLAVPMLACTLSLSDGITGKVTKVTDGDTFTLLTPDNRQERIRLDGIDAPEKGQDFSEKSRQHLAALLTAASIKVEYRNRDQYGRILGTVYADGVNVNEDMVRNGFAWKYIYSKDLTLTILQAEAQMNGLNIWSIKNPVNPYDYRKSKRNRKK